MRNLLLGIVVCTAGFGSSAMAQTAPTPAPQKLGGGQSTPSAQAPAAPVSARPPAINILGVSPVPSATNLKLEIALTDSYTGTPVTKTVSMLMMQGNGGMIRTGNGFAFLNVDAVAVAYQNGMVSVKLTFEYLAAQPKEGPLAGARVPTLNESITVVLQDGKPLQVSQSADATTDRKVTVEVTATILK